MALLALDKMLSQYRAIASSEVNSEPKIIECIRDNNDDSMFEPYRKWKAHGFPFSKQVQQERCRPTKGFSVDRITNLYKTCKTIFPTTGYPEPKLLVFGIPNKVQWLHLISKGRGSISPQLSSFIYKNLQGTTITAIFDRSRIFMFCRNVVHGSEGHLK